MKLKKTDFTLRIQTPPEDWGMESKYEISAWDKDLMIDQHIAESFPELEDLGLCDLQEGSMEYDSELTMAELRDALIELGFRAVIKKSK